MCRCRVGSYVRVKHDDLFNFWVMRINRVHVQRPEIRRNVAMLLRGHRLIFEKQHMVFDEQRQQFRALRGRQRFAEVNIRHNCTDCGRQLLGLHTSKLVALACVQLSNQANYIK